MRQLGVTTFGGLRFQRATGAEVQFSTRKAAALVAYLALHPGRRFPREALGSLLWGDKGDAQARQSLRQALSDIRRKLGEGLIRGDGGLIWTEKNCFSVDALDLPALVGLGTLSALEQAQTLYRGEFLAFGELGQEDYDHWLLLERERLRAIVQRGLAALLARRSRKADVDLRVQTARAILALDPFDETTHCVLMRAYAEQGLTSLAVKHFHRLSRELQLELGLAPRAETIAAFKAICACPEPRAHRPRTQHHPKTLSEFTFVLEQLPHPVVVTDLKNRIVGWNPLAEEAFGFTKAEMCGRSPTHVYAPDGDQLLADVILKQALSAGRWSGSVTLVGKDGRRCRQTRIVAPLFGPQGELLGAFGHGLAI